MNTQKNIFAYILIISSFFISATAQAATDFLKFPDLSLGQTSTFVKEVQKVLNNNGFVITNKGPGSIGQESNYFGGLTKKALVNFQAKNNILPATGNFGPKTKAALASFLASGKFKGISSGKPVGTVQSTATCASSAGVPGWAMCKDSNGKLIVDTKNANLGVMNLKGEISNYKGVILYLNKSGTSEHYNFLVNNVLIDGYNFRTPGNTCRTKADCSGTMAATSDDVDIGKIWGTSSGGSKTVWLKNIEIRNGPKFDALAHTDVIQTFDVPHTDVRSEKHWLAIQDSSFKNSDDNMLLLTGNSYAGVLIQNVNVGQESAYNDDCIYRRSISRSTGDCGKGYLGFESYLSGDAWVINFTNSGFAAGFSFNDNRAGRVIRINTATSSVVSAYKKICAYSTIEAALADTDMSDGCGNFEKPPFIEASCAGWANPPAGCESRRGYLGTDPVAPATSYPLYVTKTGTGASTGSVTSAPAGINCGSDCSESYSLTANTVVTLTANPNGADFTGWSGGSCSGTSPTCTVTMNGAKSVTATFDIPVIPYAPGARITVTNSGSPSVNVRNDTAIDPSNLVGTQNNGNTGTIACGPVTAGGTTWWKIDFDNGADGWSGQNNLTVTSAGTYSGPINCSGAVTTPTPAVTYILSAAKTGTGTGLINGINAASTEFDTGTSVPLTAQADSGSTFTGWSGACTGNSTTCTILMDGPKNITANFTLNTVVAPTFTPATITAPASNAVSPVDTQNVTISWNPVAGANAYYIRAKEFTNSSKTTQTSRKYSGNTNNTTFYLYKDGHTGTSISLPVQNGHYYDFWVHGYNTSDENNYSEETHTLFSVANSVVVADADNDGVADSADKCLNTPSNLISKVNAYGCPKPVYSNVKMINNATTTDLTNIPNLEIRDAAEVYGKIVYSQPVNLFGTGSTGAQVNLDSNVTISNKKVVVNSDAAPHLNKPATVTLYNVNYVKPMILKDDAVYATSSSNLVNYNATTKTLTFTVSGFSEYEVIEGAPTYTLTASKKGTGAGNIVGIDSAVTTYVEGTTLTLTATPLIGSTFTGWSGDCIGTGACLVAMQSDKSVTATFTADIIPPGTGGTTSGGTTSGGTTSGGTTSGGTTSGGTTSGGTNTSGAYVNPNNTGLGTVTTTTTSGYTFVKDLKVNARDNEVIKLQQFLNARGYTVATKGAGSPGLESTYFGPATQVALAKFQRDNKITPAQGYFGALTKAFINKAGGTTTTVTAPVVNTNTTTTGKYIFTKNLTVNSRDPEVIQLQKFLNSKGYIISTKGAGSPGLESNYFGPATRTALARWQKDNGISPAAGYFGTLTKAYLNR